MKKFVLTLLASVLIGTSVNAQEAKCGSCKKQDKAQHKTEMMAQKLGLDEAQKAKERRLLRKEGRDREEVLQGKSCRRRRPLQEAAGPASSQEDVSQEDEAAARRIYEGTSDHPEC